MVGGLEEGGGHFFLPNLFFFFFAFLVFVFVFGFAFAGLLSRWSSDEGRTSLVSSFWVWTSSRNLSCALGCVARRIRDQRLGFRRCRNNLFKCPLSPPKQMYAHIYRRWMGTQTSPYLRAFWNKIRRRIPSASKILFPTILIRGNTIIQK